MSSRTMRKRARTGSISATSNDAVAHHSGNMEAALRKHDEEFWYSDGNIILVARDVEFCVFKGILAKHSPVFRDMFSLPQPPAAASATSSLDNTCPVVHLSDSPEDLRHVLRAYMPTGGPSAFFHSAPLYSYHAISAAVRLGHKYQMSDLLDNALGYLKTYYPTKFDKWRACVEYGPPGFDLPSLYTIGVVNLARLTGENGLLLMALLVCCTIRERETIVHGFEREDGSREQLTLDDIGLCYAAKTTLMDISVQIMLRVCRPEVSVACKTIQSCSQAFKDVLGELETTREPITHPDPSVENTGLSDALVAAALCMPCKAMVKKRDLRERKAAWGRLEDIFGVHLPEAASGEGQAVENSGTA